MSTATSARRATIASTPSPAATASRPQQRRRVADVHQAASASGTGTCSSTASTMVSGATLLSHSSGPDHDPVAERGHGEALDVLGDDEVAALDQRQRARAQQQRERAARRRPHHGVLVLAGGADQVDGVAAHRLGHVDVLHALLHGQQPGRVEDGLHRHLLAPPPHPAGQHVPLLVERRIPEGQPQQEPVQLGLGQRVGALVLDGVGGGQHVEGPRQHERVPLDGDLPLLHGLQQRGLRLGRGAVDLVGQQQAGEDRALAEAELGRVLVEDVGAGEVGGSRSGVNWARVNSRPSACASERAASVLPSPGRSSSRTWPPARTPASTSVIWSRLPTRTVSTASRTWATRAVASCWARAVVLIANRSP